MVDGCSEGERLNAEESTTRCEAYEQKKDGDMLVTGIAKILTHNNFRFSMAPMHGSDLE